MNQQISITKSIIKTGILSVMVIISLFMFGCQGNVPTDQNFRTGFLDVAVSTEGTNKIYQEDQFDLMVLIHNQLGYDIKNVAVSLVGLDEAFIEVYSPQKTIDTLEGRSNLFETGEEERLLFETYIKSLPPGIIGEVRNLYRVFVKYNSEIILTEDVCIRPGLYTGVDDGGCKAGENAQKDPLQEGKNTLSGQGAPVGFSEAEVISKVGSEVELRLKLVDQGRGNDGKVGTVTLIEAALGGKNLNCEFRKAGGAGKQVMFDSSETEVSLVCRGALGRESSYSYVTPLTIKLQYDYEFSIQEELFILN
ncbi:MAG: hypothetical protein AABW48_04510 [Nanoarchaeota archaeon]